MVVNDPFIFIDPFIFVKRVSEIAEGLKPGDSSEGNECPDYNEKALIVCKSALNGHIHAKCVACSRTLIQ